ncbi:hypothetical protein GE061_018099, partial [Apolygus lucorum]
TGVRPRFSSKPHPVRATAVAADVVPAICETPPKNEPEKQPAVADASPTSRLQAYMMLSKFRLTSLVVMTSMSGYAMAPGVFDLPTVAMCAVGTGLMSASANAVNQFFEVPFDSQMARTRNRLLVKSVVTPLHAFYVRRDQCHNWFGSPLLWSQPIDSCHWICQSLPLHVCVHSAQTSQHNQHLGRLYRWSSATSDGLGWVHRCLGAWRVGPRWHPLRLAVPPFQRSFLEPSA